GFRKGTAYYCFTGAGVVLAGTVFTVFTDFTFFTVFGVFVAALTWCFFVVFTGAATAGLEVAAGAAGAGVWAANVSGMVASARAMVRIVVFILFFLPRGLYRPLTIPYCALCPGNSIACVRYAGPRIRVYRGYCLLGFVLARVGDVPGTAAARY